MRVGQGIDQLHIDADLVVRFLHASFEDVGHAELLCDLGKLSGALLKSLRRRARDHF